MSVYIIDYENVDVNGLTGIEKLLDTDIVIIFYSVCREKIDIKAVEKMWKSKAIIHFKEANVKIKETDKVFHDALDAQLDTYVGYLMGKYNDKETAYYIVSKDQGFGFVCEFWCNRGYHLSQIESIHNGNANVKIEKIDTEVEKLIEDRQISKNIAKIIREHKTKNGIYSCLVKKYTEKAGREYYIKIKPLIKDKK